jgi:hypothetical protein
VQAGFNQDDVRRRALASAVDADTAPAASAAASPGRRSCRDSYVMFSGGEMRFGGSRAGRARGDDDGRRTGVGSRGRGRLRASAFRRSPTRPSSSHHDLTSSSPSSRPPRRIHDPISLDTHLNGPPPLRHNIRPSTALTRSLLLREQAREAAAYAAPVSALPYWVTFANLFLPCEL